MVWQHGDEHQIPDAHKVHKLAILSLPLTHNLTDSISDLTQARRVVACR